MSLTGSFATDKVMEWTARVRSPLGFTTHAKVDAHNSTHGYRERQTEKRREAELPEAEEAAEAITWLTRFSPTRQVVSARAFAAKHPMG
jgi:hypothetical protein